MRGLAVFFYTLVFVANAALIMMLMVGFFFCFFFCFFGDLISEGTFCHILEFQTFLEVLQSC